MAHGYIMFSFISNNVVQNCIASNKIKILVLLVYWFLFFNPSYKLHIWYDVITLVKLLDFFFFSADYII